MSTLRCFVAVELDDTVRDALRSAADAVCARDAAWRDEKWVSADRLHVTIKFLGDVGEGQLGAIEAALAQAGAHSAPFELTVKGLRAVPGTRGCRMLWASFDDPSGGCSALAAAVEESLLELGFDAEKRAFKPHATLCRARRPRRLSASHLQGAEGSGELLGTSMSVGSFSLISSKLGRGEPVYTTLMSWPLAGKRA